MAYDEGYVKGEMERAKKLELEAKHIREQVTLYKRYQCDHPKKYVRTYYDGSSDAECDVCGIPWYSRP